MKLIPIILGALVVAAVAYGIFVYSSKPQTAQNGEPTQNVDGSFTGSLADLLKRTGDWKCTFGTEGTGFTSSGTAYVSGSKIRADFTSQIKQINQTVDSHMIQDDGYVYVWTSLAPQGFKAKTTLGSTDASKQFTAQNINIDQQYQYNCQAWTADTATFTLPTNVTFVGQ